jgi:fatty acid desaturase
MAILMHEALHGSLFRSRKWDRWAAFALGVPAFFSGAAYKAIHLNHHRHTRTAKDQDEIGNSCRTRAQFLAWIYLRYVAGTFLYFFVVPLKALAIAAPAVRQRIVEEYLAMFGIYAAVTITFVSVGHVSWLLWYWLLPVNVAMVLSNVRGNAEHVGTGAGSALLISRTVTSSQLVSFLMCNLNYHLEHHLFPGVPWYNLPKVHQLLRPVYAKAGAHVERSYVRHTILALSGALDLTSDSKLPR